MHQSRDTKQSITTEFLLSMHSSLLLYISKALIQVPRNIQDHVIAHFALYFVFFFSVQSILYRESPQNWQFLSYDQTIGKSIKMPPPHGSLTIINNRWPCSIIKCANFLYQSALLNMADSKWLI